MIDKKNLILHQKSKSINNNLSLKDLVYSNTNNDGNYIPNNYNNINNYIREEQMNKENKFENNISYTIDEIKQNILDLYYDNNSSFKNQIDNLNLQFYLETEKYLNYNKTNDIVRSQKLQANLFIILFKQINIFIQEIERLNKIIIENKYVKENILQRTNEIKEKKQNFLIKNNLIQSLKQSNTNTEKKLLETLLNEDKLIKDNERLRKENETYKSLTIVFENELRNNKKNSSTSPIEKKNFIKHIKTYSDYGFSSNKNLGDIYGGTIGKSGTLPYENKSPLRDKKIISINNRNKEFCMNNKYKVNLNNKNKIKNKIQKIYSPKNNNIKINNCSQLLRNNTLRETIKISLNKPSLNNKQKNKKSQDNKNEELINMKNKTKIDFSSSNKFSSNNKNNNNKLLTHKNRIIINHNLGNNNSFHNKKPVNFKKIKNIKKNNKNLKLNLNNISSTTNVIMTEINKTSSTEKDKNKNFKRIPTQIGYKKKRNMSEFYFNEIIGIQNLNDEINNSLFNINHEQNRVLNKTKKEKSKNKNTNNKALEENKGDKFEKSLFNDKKNKKK